MKQYRDHNYYVYVITNQSRKVLYVGVTNNLKRRLLEHKTQSETVKKSFAGRYNCIYLVYFEHHGWIQNAIKREKEIKGWLRIKKIKLIEDFNPTWKFLNESIEDL
jgi:putative endonuclease